MSRGGHRAREEVWAGSQETWVWNPAPRPTSLSLCVPSCQVRVLDYVLTKAPSRFKKNPPDLGPAGHTLEPDLLRMHSRSTGIQPAGRTGHPLPGPRVQRSPGELASVPELYFHVTRKGLFPKCEPCSYKVISGLHFPECVFRSSWGMDREVEVK